MFAFISSHWVQILAALTSAWTALNALFNRIANSMLAPTATSSPKYIFWFRFFNYGSLNWKRAENNARIEDSPNFEAAAEAYMQRKLLNAKTPGSGK